MVDKERQSKPANVGLPVVTPFNTDISPAVVPTAVGKLISGKQSTVVNTLFDTGAQYIFHFSGD